ncbi:Histidine phosphatase superfamily, clade-2 like protein [Aduncisulcus paluster]|uniref:Histidine phosphatase superfamily, clade-2 like protein n=1 Tax=Aduncisulcus paluster TaxID=2918883 RepID=A0ABQ5KX67_9EUKA|nr:Histidine phosphatase superfamily, clade-2 like protein [Aduncisulcus paluster]
MNKHGARAALHALVDEPYDWNCGGMMIDSYTQGDYSSLPNSFIRYTYTENNNTLPGSCALGQLTENGYSEHKTLGEQWKDIYGSSGNGLLPSEYDPSRVLLRSVDLPRTHQSLKGELDGMFPDFSGYYQVETTDYTRESMVSDVSHCTELNEVRNAIYEEPGWVFYMAELESDREDLCLATGDTTYTYGWDSFYDNFTARTAQGVPFPDPVTYEEINQTNKYADFRMKYEYGGVPDTPDRTTYQSLGIGRFMTELADEWDSVLDCVESGADVCPTFRFYSGQDITISPMMSVIGDWDYTWPPYAAHIQLELVEDVSTDEVFIRALYQDEAIIMEGCNEIFCPIDTVSARWRSFYPENYDERCY